METKCPDCKGKFSLDELDYDHGDLLNCPECNLELVVEKGKKKLIIKSYKEHYLENFDEEDYTGEETELL